MTGLAFLFVEFLAGGYVLIAALSAASGFLR
jgi:hypothetical protein